MGSKRERALYLLRCFESRDRLISTFQRERRKERSGRRKRKKAAGRARRAMASGGTSDENSGSTQTDGKAERYAFPHPLSFFLSFFLFFYYTELRRSNAPIHPFPIFLNCRLNENLKILENVVSKPYHAVSRTRIHISIRYHRAFAVSGYHRF